MTRSDVIRFSFLTLTMSHPTWQRNNNEYEGYDFNINMQQLSLHDPAFQPFIPYTGQSAFPYPYYDPYFASSNQTSPINPSTPFPPWSPPTSPNIASRGRLSIPGSSGQTFNRMTWSGPDKARERKAYHPQPPTNRSDWVMWVGNV